MNISKQIIMLIGFSLIVSVQSNLRYSYGKYYSKNIKKSIINNCNKIALDKTNDYDIYKCIINNNPNCSDYKNYSNFIDVKNKCIKEFNNYIQMTLCIVILSWIIIGTIF